MLLRGSAIALVLLASFGMHANSTALAADTVKKTPKPRTVSVLTEQDAKLSVNQTACATNTFVSTLRGNPKAIVTHTLVLQTPVLPSDGVVGARDSITLAT